MAAGIAISVVGDERGVLHMLNVLDTALNPAALVLFLEGVVDPHLRERAAERFADEGDDVVGQWSPLKPATVSIRESKGFGGAHPINVRTGEMYRYIVEEDGNALPTPYGASLTLPGRPATGELADKVTRAQQGDNRTVARPVIGMNEVDLAWVLVALSKHIEGAGKSMGVKSV